MFLNYSLFIIFILFFKKGGKNTIAVNKQMELKIELEIKFFINQKFFYPNLFQNMMEFWNFSFYLKIK